MHVDLTILGTTLSAILATSAAVAWHLYVALAAERDGRARELREFEEAIRRARASLLDLDAPAPRTVAEPEPLLDVGGYRSNPRRAPVIAVRAAAPPSTAWHVAPVASMLREF